MKRKLIPRFIEESSEIVLKEKTEPYKEEIQAEINGISILKGTQTFMFCKDEKLTEDIIRSVTGTLKNKLEKWGTLEGDIKMCFWEEQPQEGDIKDPFFGQFDVKKDKQKKINFLDKEPIKLHLIAATAKKSNKCCAGEYGFAVTGNQNYFKIDSEKKNTVKPAVVLNASRTKLTEVEDVLTIDIIESIFEEKCSYKTIYIPRKSIFINSEKKAKELKIKLSKEAIEALKENERKDITIHLPKLSYILASMFEHKSVEEIYDKNKDKIAKTINIEYLNEIDVFTQGTTKTTKLAKKIYAIIMWELKGEDLKNTKTLFKKNSPIITNYINSKGHYSVSEFMDYCNKKDYKIFLAEISDLMEMGYFASFIMKKDIYIFKNLNVKEINKKSSRCISKKEMDSLYNLSNRIFSKTLDKVEILNTDTPRLISKEYFNASIKYKSTKYFLEKNENIDEKDGEIFNLIMIINCLSKALQDEKNYWKNNKDVGENDEIKRLKEENEKLKKDLKTKEKRLKKDKHNKASLKKENKKIEKEKDEIKEEKSVLADEVYYLKKILKEKEIEEEKDLKTEDRTKTILQKGVIASAREETERKLKKRLPNFDFIGADELNFDVKRLNGEECIFYIAEYGSHGLYRKVKGAVNNKDRLHYINVTNVDLIIKEIETKLTSLKKDNGK